MPTVTYPHIEISPEGKIFIAGTRFKIKHIILDRIAYGWDADEIQRQHPQLSLAQIYAALTYYYDHQTEMDKLIADDLREADEFFEKQGPPPFLEKLLAAKRAR